MQWIEKNICFWLKIDTNYCIINYSMHGIYEEKKIPQQEIKMHYTYMLQCKDGTYYIGYTNDLEKRVKAHNEGKGAKYTKGRGPVELIYYEEYEEKSIAMRREWEMKRMTRSQKEELRKIHKK